VHPLATWEDACALLTLRTSCVAYWGHRSSGSAVRVSRRRWCLERFGTTTLEPAAGSLTVLLRRASHADHRNRVRSGLPHGELLASGRDRPGSGREARHVTAQQATTAPDICGSYRQLVRVPAISCRSDRTILASNSDVALDTAMRGYVLMSDRLYFASWMSMVKSAECVLRNIIVKIGTLHGPGIDDVIPGLR
jgi:hypothetical protein